MNRTIFYLIVAGFFYLPTIPVCLALGNPDKKEIAELEARVKNILSKDNVSQRPDINDVFKLADIYADQGNIPQARKFYEAGLSVDSFRFDYQLKIANILRQAGDINQAIEKYKTAYSYAEDEQVINSAKEQLLSLKIDCPQPEQKESKFTIVIVPFGKINRVFVDELMSGLNRATGIKYTLSQEQLPLGPFDRTNSQRYLSNLCKKIKVDTPTINPPPDTDPNAQLDFVIRLLRKEGTEPKKVDEFRAKMIENFKVGQRDADRLISQIQSKFSSVNDPAISGFLGITEADIYNGDNNFLFGTARSRFGVMSYCRFTGTFNETPQNRPRMLKRAVKQGLSSTFFILGIPRCTNAMCARAYPNSLEEQDLKEVELCGWCKEQLAKKLQNK